MKKIASYTLGLIICFGLIVGTALLLKSTRSKDPISMPTVQVTVGQTPTPPLLSAKEDRSFQVWYRSYRGNPVALEFNDRNGCITLELLSDEKFEFRGGLDTSLELMKYEVIRFTSTTNVVPLAEGHNIQFKGDGYPIWHPHYADYGMAGVYRRLTFAVGAVLIDKTIVFQGLEFRPEGRYPYPM